jgi:acyl dehydratase
MIDYQAVKDWNFGEIVQTYNQRDTMLYALGLGMGADPLDEGQLRFVYEKNLQTMPTMATVLGSPGFWWRDPRTGADWVKLVHGEQRIRLLQPLPIEATVVGRNRVVSINDKGAGKGAIAVLERDIVNQASGDLLARITQVNFLRGDGGYSATGGQSDPGPEPLPTVPDRSPDFIVDLPTLPQQALIYRLSGDYNILHSDPAVAKAAGFQQPILHGLCTYGMAAFAALKAVCAYDSTRIRGLDVRFTSPVFPGEPLRFEFWKRGDSGLHLRAQASARNVTVLNNGVVEFT